MCGAGPALGMGKLGSLGPPIIASLEQESKKEKKFYYI